MTAVALALGTGAGGCKKQESSDVPPAAEKPVASPPAAVPAPAPAPAPAAVAPEAAATDSAQAKEVSFSDAVNEADELTGKVIIVSATSWGTSQLKGGGSVLNLGSKPLTGMQQTLLEAYFAPGEEAALAAVAKDAKVKLRCTMGTRPYEAYQLKDCRFVK
ncbi:MAG: hypothetical protein H6Q90_2803 [Deltaproteobacteria bacterium]|nr:hypothetical protein [Deltaproteobacteria bacterium]